ncbi:acylphosphatase [Isosphaeraceae bacterium EP7]
MAIERRHLYYQGRVQGVGFRARTERIAAGYALSGFVRNLDDGRVELVVEGELGEIQPFLAALDRELGRHIRDISQTTEHPEKPIYDGFTIEY